MDRDYETIGVEDKGEGLMLLTLNRPQVANAMNTQMGHDLLAFFDAVNGRSPKYVSWLTPINPDADSISHAPARGARAAGR